MSADRAAQAIGVARRTVYDWRLADERFRAEWDEACDLSTDALEAKLYDMAKKGDVTALIFMLRSRKAEVYNPNLVMRKTMLQLALEKARSEMNGTPLIDGRAEGPTIANLETITVIWLPWNARTRSPHLPADFDPAEHAQGAPLPLIPFPQDGSGLTLPLPRKVMVEVHPDGELPVSLVADGKAVLPKAATDLWHRIQAFNRGVVLLHEALDPGWSERRQPQPLGYGAADLAEKPPPDDTPHDEDCDPPATIETDWSGGFGRP